MSKVNAFQIWVEKGYDLFAEAGIEGLHVERLARELNLNKSGFYHYFGDMEFFLDQVLKFHYSSAMDLATDLSMIKNFDPDFINVFLTYPKPVLVHAQLVRFKDHPKLRECFEKVNSKVDNALLPAWAKFVGLPQNHKLALKYFEMHRDMFYARFTPADMNFEYMHQLIHEAKNLVAEIQTKSSTTATT